jgi:DUF971 family protein
MMSGPVTPTDAKLVSPDLLSITWSDGRTLVYPTPFLRAQCPCAECIDEWTGEVRIAESQFGGVTLSTLKQVGRYAFNVAFSDRHHTGIYTYERLLKIGRPADEPAAPGT